MPRPRLSLEQFAGLCHGRAMNGRFTQAGGCLLALAILAGTIAGAMAGAAMKGVLIGTGVGIALALLLWLIDRRR